MEMKHTPGPWHAEKIGGRVLARLRGHKPTPRVVAQCSAFCTVTADETSANARLIAAAPEMLDVCKYALTMLEDRYDGADDSPTQWMAGPILDLRAAIAKAEGR